jgi:hypothetical protein
MCEIRDDHLSFEEYKDKVRQVKRIQKRTGHQPIGVEYIVDCPDWFLEPGEVINGVHTSETSHSS